MRSVYCEKCGLCHACDNGYKAVSGFSRVLGNNARLLVYMKNVYELPIYMMGSNVPDDGDNNQLFINLQYRQVMELRDLLNLWLERNKS